jgi:hypothetical protein
VGIVVEAAAAVDTRAKASVVVVAAETAISRMRDTPCIIAGGRS